MRKRFGCREICEIALRPTATALGAGRLAMGTAFLVDPVLAVKILGVDTATASRVSWLARMAAARDVALGAGTLASGVRGSGTGPWLAAGVVSDIADAAIMTAATQDRALGAAHGRLAAATAVLAAAAGGWALADLLPRRRR